MVKMEGITLQKVEGETAHFSLPFPSSWKREGVVGFGDVRVRVQLDCSGATTLLVTMDAVGTIPTWKFAKLFEDVVNWVAEETDEVFFLMERIDTDTRFTGRSLPKLWASATLSVSDRESTFKAIIEKARRMKEEEERRW